jgi:hypothetical protein
LTFAQEPAAFEMSVIPWSEQAVAGEPFTYTVVVTSLHPTPVQDIIVFMRTPTGTTFAGTYQDNKWFVSGLGPGEVGMVGWTTLEPISSSQIITFELGVNVLPEMANQLLVNDEYGIVFMNEDELIGSGPPLETEVLVGLPTATPLPTNTPTPVQLPTTTPSNMPVIPAVANTATPSPTATIPLIQTETDQAPPVSTNRTLIITMAITLILFASIGLIWFLKRK